MNKKIKIVFTISALISGGAEISLYDICRYIHKDYFEVILISILKGDELEKKFEALPNVNMIKLGFKNRLHPLIVPKLRRLFKSLKPDLIHTNLPVANIYSRVASIILKTKIITTFHSPVFKKSFFYLVEKLTSGMNDWIIANSTWSKNKLIEHNYISEAKIKVIHLGIDFHKFKEVKISKNDFCEKYNISESAKIIAYIASFKQQKGHIYLLETIKNLHIERPDYYFFLVGKGMLLGEMKEKAKEYQIEKNTIFTGNISDIGEILSFCDLFVSPSLAESFGVALVETMFFRVPIVAFSVDAVPEIVIDNETGYLVEIYNINELKNGILKVLDCQSSDINKITENAYNMALTNFSIENTVQNLETFYFSILDRYIDEKAKDC